MPDTNAPNFLVVGAQKAGTTYLCDKLADHPDIFISASKEPMFFQRKMTDQTFAEYRQRHFPESNAARWRGEGSTTYFQIPRALTNIRKALSRDLRIIICLRQPTEKAVSAYIHNWRHGKYPNPIGILDSPRLSNKKLGPLKASRYFPSMRRWLSVYPREQVEVILFDTLKKDPAGFVSQALRFLDLDGVASVSKDAVNKGPELVWDGDILTVTDPKRRWRPVIHKSELLQLHESYIRDIERLDSLLHLGISHWKNFPTFTRKRVDAKAA